MNFEDISLSTLSPGTYTIKAIFDGDDTYNPKTTTFMLVVGERPEDTHVVIDLDNNQGEAITPTLSFSSSELTIIQDGINFIYPLLTPINPSNKPLEWTSSSENITIDVSNNTMEVRELGVYTITATIIDDTLETPVSASYTVTVQDEDGNTTKVPKDFRLYFESNLVTYYDLSPENDKYVLQVPKTTQTDDNIVPSDLLSLFYYTVGDDETNIFPATQGFIPKEYFTEYGNYTITLNFNGNNDWLPTELTYTLSIVERSDAGISFTNQNVTYSKQNDTIYQLQNLNNPHDLPITWSSTGTNVMINSENSTVKINDNDEYTIIATFNGNELYRPAQATYNIKIVPSQEEARIYFEHDNYSYSAASGLISTAVLLINPAGLPITYTISDPNATVEDANNGKWYYCNISSSQSINNATITATFAGDDVYEAMTATCTYSLDKNTSQTGNSGLSFTNPVDRQAGNYYGTYQLQSLNNPNNLPVTWQANISNYYCKIDVDNGLVYVNEYFPNITISVTFKGNDQYDAAHVDYELQITRQDVTLSFDESIVTVNDVEEGKATSHRLQYASSEPFGLSLDYNVYNLANSDWKLPITLKNDGNMYVDLSTATTWMVYASFRGDMVYKPATTSYAITVNTIVKENINLKFNDATITINTATTELELQSLYWKLASQDDTFWTQVSYDSSSADYLDVDISCESDLLILTVDKTTGKIYLYDSNNQTSNIPNGTYTITANFYGNSTYSAASTSYRVVVSNSQQGGGDDPGNNKTPNGIQWNIAITTFEQTNDNTYWIPLIDVNPYNLPITYTVYGPTGATLTGNELYCPTIGTVTIEASYPGDATYYPYLESRTFTITSSQQNPSAYQNEYLTFEALSNNTNLYFFYTGVKPPAPASVAKTIQYSTDKINWHNYKAIEGDASGNPMITLNAGQKVYLRGNNSSYGSFSEYHHYFSTGNTIGRFNVYGNIMSMINSTNFSNLTTLTGTSNFVGFFEKMRFVDASNLVLPATTLAEFCYANMFYDCTSLTSAPVLPATTLAEFCYKYMFCGCTSLTSAPVLPATTLVYGCYGYMFSGCTSLTSAPVLPATTLAEWCYGDMFRDCTSLTSAPVLPATTLAPSCYADMFMYCSSLVTPPVLPATTLADNCYKQMFYYCLSLNYIKMLATNISALNCLSYWVLGVASTGTFVKNSSMTSLPSGNSGIPTGWTVQDNGSSGSGGSATTPSQLLDNGIIWTKSNTAYQQNTTTNTYQVTLVQTNPYNLPITYTVYGPTGTTLTGNELYCPSTGTVTIEATFISDGVYTPFNDSYTISIISSQSGGSDSQYKNEYLTIESLEDNNRIAWGVNGRSSYGKTIYYSTNKINWYSITASKKETIFGENYYVGGTTITTLNSGDKLYIYGNNSSYSTKNGSAWYSNGFISSGRYKVYGNIMSLINNSSFSYLSSLDTVCSFRSMFARSKIVDASNLILPAMVLSPGCYLGMFSECKLLTSTPVLPATTLTESCYSQMFIYCTSLTSAPALPATTLAEECYDSMFYGCTSLTSAPVLPATTLVKWCYDSMFFNCTNLNYIKMLATNISASSCLRYWVYNVAASGTFVKNSSMTSLTTGENGIPTGWTVQDDGSGGSGNSSATPSELLTSDIVYGVSDQTYIYDPTTNTYPIQFVTQNPHNLPITYSVSGGQVNGSNVYIPATGTYTVVATFEGDSTYQPWSGTYFITITPQ